MGISINSRPKSSKHSNPVQIRQSIAPMKTNGSMIVELGNTQADTINQQAARVRKHLEKVMKRLDKARAQMAVTNHNSPSGAELRLKIQRLEQVCAKNVFDLQNLQAQALKRIDTDNKKRKLKQQELNCEIVRLNNSKIVKFKRTNAKINMALGHT